MDKSTNENTEGFTPRQTQRAKKLSLKAVESAYLKKFKASGLVNKPDSSENDSSDEFDDLEVEKPAILQSNVDVTGNKIFTFNTRKKGMMQKVQEVHEQLAPKTPNSVRSKINKRITSQLREENNSDENSDPYSDSGSEFCASDSEESTDSKSSNSSDSSEKISASKSGASKKSKIDVKNIAKTKGFNTRRRNNYRINTEEYFSHHSTKKITTSNHTLDKLDTPRLPQDQLQKLMENMKLSHRHQKCMNSLAENNQGMFSKWLYLLHENFNVLLYGLGSKRAILNKFQIEYLGDNPVIVVNGFFPTLSIKDVIDGILVDLLESKENPANIFKGCEMIENEFGSMSEVHLFLIVHNIDGDMLRNGKAQSVLARLAAVKNIHLLASIDHINAPLVWDHTKLSKFNFTWWDVTSFLPYLDETSFETSLMVQRTGNLALSSLNNVFLSLTTNSKGIYMIIVKHQLKNGKDQYYQGLAFKDLYWACREAFLVSSDLALRAQMTEFVDHKMVKSKRSVDGVEHLIIPLPNALLQKFLDEQQN